MEAVAIAEQAPPRFGEEPFAGRSVLLAKETTMNSETGNAKAKQEQQGSSNPNEELQKAQAKDSNARDRENRKGGDNAKNL